MYQIQVYVQKDRSRCTKINTMYDAVLITMMYRSPTPDDIDGIASPSFHPPIIWPCRLEKYQKDRQHHLATTYPSTSTSTPIDHRPSTDLPIGYATIQKMFNVHVKDVISSIIGIDQPSQPLYHIYSKIIYRGNKSFNRRRSVARAGISCRSIDRR